MKESILNSSRFPINRQSILLAIWFGSLVLSIVLYGKEILTANTGFCSYPDLTNIVIGIVQPKNWLGIFTLAITAFGGARIFKGVISKWPVVDQYKWVGLFGIFFALTAFFGFGCK